MSSKLSDSGSSGLSDWALVNVQGELEGSDVDSNTSSIEVMGTEDGETTAVHHDISCSESTPECIELEQLMHAADENASLLKEQDKSCLQSEKHLGSASLLRTSEPQECSSSISPILNQDCLSQELFAKPDPIPQGALCPQLLHALEATHAEDLVRATISGLELSEIKEEIIPSSSESIVSLPDSTCPSLPARSDSDNDSDFVRLEKESTCGTLTDEEESQDNSRANAMSTSESSVGSAFNFFLAHRVPLELHLPLPIPPSVLPPPPPPPPPSPPSPPPPPQHMVPILAVNNSLFMNDDDDADTESSTELDQDDRIESEQSDDAHSAQADEQEPGDLSTLSDIGDLPLVPGEVERHYVHCNNQQLNIKLNRVVFVAILLACGLGLGHWIGSAREQYSQMEMQLAQMRKLHEMQDEYVHCLSRNDELLLFTDKVLEDLPTLPANRVTVEKVPGNTLDGGGDGEDDVIIEVEEEETSYSSDDISDSLKEKLPFPVIQKKCDKEIPQTVPIDINLLHRNLSHERQRADMWQRLYISQRQYYSSLNSSIPKEPAINTSSCLHFLMQHMNTSAFLDYLTLWNVTGSTVDDFANLTYLVSSISNLQQSLMQTLPSLWDQLSATFHEMHSENSPKENLNTNGETSSEKTEDSDKAFEEDRTKRKSKWSEGVKNLLNKTRTTMSNVSHHLKQTWRKVKDASQKLWPEKNSVIGRMAARVTESMENFSRKVQDKASNWFSKSTKKDKHSHGKTGHHDSREEDKKQSSPQYENHQHHQTDLKFNTGRKSDSFHTKTKHGVKPGKVDKMILKQFQKLFNKMSHMSHKDFERMHVGDRKSMFKVFNEVLASQGHTGAHLPEANQKWLKCQMKWWNGIEKGIYLRDDDCWRHLTGWQNARSDSYQRRVPTKRREHKYDGVSPKGNREEEHEVRKETDSPRNENLSNSETLFPSQANATSADGFWYLRQGEYRKEQHSKWLADNEQPTWYFDRAKGRDQIRQDSSHADWVFERAADRSSKRQNEREADWLFERASLRESARQEIQDSKDKGLANQGEEKNTDHQKRDYRQKYGQKVSEGFC